MQKCVIKLLTLKFFGKKIKKKIYLNERKGLLLIHLSDI